MTQRDGSDLRILCTDPKPSTGKVGVTPLSLRIERQDPKGSEERQGLVQPGIRPDLICAGGGATDLRQSSFAHPLTLTILIAICVAGIAWMRGKSVGSYPAGTG